MIKGGFVLGTENGRGVATCRTADGWSALAFFAVTGGSSFGLQIGVEGIDLVMIIQNEKGMQQLLASKFQIGADASAAAGPVGRHASADTDWKLNTEILTYSRAKGAFAGLTLKGASIRRDDDSMHAMYGGHVTTRAALTGTERKFGTIPRMRLVCLPSSDSTGGRLLRRRGGRLSLPKWVRRIWQFGRGFDRLV